MERLYSEDSYIREFKAEITNIAETEKGLEILLSKSAFYPESGGQPADKGWINDIQVLELCDTDEGLKHILHTAEFTTGQEVSCRIDWERRFDHMQHHTGQHILSQAFVETCSAETVSFHLGEDSVTIDLSVESLSDEVLQEAELLANRVVTDNLPVKVYEIDSAQQESLPVRKPSARTGLIRIVEIDGWEYSPCGGTHCRNTGEVGLIKILRLERVRQQLRVHFCCGKRALLDYRNKAGIVSESGQLLSCGENDLPVNIQKMIDSGRQATKQLQKIQGNMLSLIADQMRHSLIETGDFRIAVKYAEGISLKDLNRLASTILQGDTVDLVLLAGDDPRPGVLFAGNNAPGLPDLREILSEVQPLFDGRGGGSPDRVQAGGNNPEGLSAALDKARDLIIDALEG